MDQTFVKPSGKAFVIKNGFVIKITIAIKITTLSRYELLISIHMIILYISSSG